MMKIYPKNFKFFISDVYNFIKGIITDKTEESKTLKIIVIIN